MEVANCNLKGNKSTEVEKKEMELGGRKAKGRQRKKPKGSQLEAENGP
jgi:hypothetical protein